MKTPLDVKSSPRAAHKPDPQKLLSPYNIERKRSSVDSSTTITGGRSRSGSTNSTTLSLISSDELTKEFKASKQYKSENVLQNGECKTDGHNRDHSKSGKTTQNTHLFPSTAVQSRHKTDHDPLSRLDQLLDQPRSTLSARNSPRSTTNSPKRCKEKRHIFRMGSSLVLSLDGSKTYHVQPINQHKNEEYEGNKKTISKHNNASRGFSPKKFISGKNTKSPTSTRKSLFACTPKSNYNSFEDDHSRKSSMSSVGSGIGGERDVGYIRNKGGVTSSHSKYLTATMGRPFSEFAQSSPSSPTRTNSIRKSNLLALTRATPSVFSSIQIPDPSSTSKSTSVSPKNSPSHKRSLFVSPYKAVSMDEGHLKGHLKSIRRYESTSSSQSSGRSSQNNLLQLPASNSYKVRLNHRINSRKMRIIPITINIFQLILSYMF